MKKCLYCGAQIADDSRFCTECGKPIPQGNVCPNCGASVNGGDLFCHSCGKRVDDNSSPSTESISNYNYKKCPHCGAPVNDSDVFCEKCGNNLVGYSINNTTENVNQQPYEKIKTSSNKMKIVLPIIIGIIFVALIGSCWYYWNKSEKTNALLTMEIIIDLYKNNNKEHITQVLKENGYSLFRSEEESEYWTKNVQLEGVKTDNGETIYEPIEKKGGSVSIYGTDNIILRVFVYSDEGFKDWEKQLLELGYKERNYDEMPPEEDGWTILGAHGNLFKLYQDSKGNSVEIMKDEDGSHGYGVFSVECK